MQDFASEHVPRLCEGLLAEAKSSDIVETTPEPRRTLARGARDARIGSMATSNISELWHGHAGARWLIPMIAVVALMVFLLLALLVYPYISA